MLTHSLTLVNRFASGGTRVVVVVGWKREVRGCAVGGRLSVKSALRGWGWERCEGFVGCGGDE